MSAPSSADNAPSTPSTSVQTRKWVTGLLAVLVIAGMTIYTCISLLDGWRLEQAKSLLAQNQPDLAWKYLSALQPSRSGSGEIAFLAAQTARRTRQPTMAKACLENAKKNGWPPEAIALEQSLLNLSSGQPGPELEELITSVEGEYLERPRVLEVLVPVLFRQFDLDRASYCATMWTQLEPENPRAWVWLGKVEEKLQNRPPAEEAFKKALEVSPNDTEALAWMARQLQRRRQPAEAITLLAKLREIDPKREDLPLIEGKCLQDLGREDDARKMLREAVLLLPLQSEGWLELGRLELNSNHPAEAEEAFRRVLQLSPSDREGLFSLSQALEKQGKKVEAEKVRLRQAQVEKDLKATRDAAQKIRETPKDPAPRVEIAALMLQNGLMQEGGRWLESALTLDPKNTQALELAKQYRFRQNGP